MERSLNYDDAMKLLSLDEAVIFLQDSFRIINVEQKLRFDKLPLLREIVFAWQEIIPFNNVRQRSNAPDKRRTPSLPENVELMLSLEGGNCWTVNTAMHILLTALGYDARITCGSTFDRDSLPSHVITFVKGLTFAESLHIVDPTFSALGAGEPVCLNFDTESQLITGVHTSYKFVKNGPWYTRCYKYKRVNNFWPENAYLEDGFVHFIYFTVEEKSFEEIKAALAESVFLNPDDFMNNDIIVTRTQARCFYMLFNNKMKIELSPGGEIKEFRLGTEREVTDAIGEYFSSVPEDVTVRAVHNLNRYRLKGKLGQAVKTKL